MESEKAPGTFWGGGIAEFPTLEITTEMPFSERKAWRRFHCTWCPFVGEQFRNVLLETGVAVFLNEPIELPPSAGEDLPAYKLTTGDVIQPDITLFATGRIPNSDELGLECVGLTSGAWIPVNEFMQTPVESIYAVGDVNGIALLDSVATAQANIAVESILGRPARFDKRRFYRFLHTKPPIASIG